jgi:hypothetical protein
MGIAYLLESQGSLTNITALGFVSFWFDRVFFLFRVDASLATSNLVLFKLFLLLHEGIALSIEG